MLQRRWIANLISSPQLCAVQNKQTPSYYQLTLHPMMAGSSVRTSSSKQHFFIARHTNCACFLWSPKGRLANEGNYAKEHITIAELYLFVSFSISRGESLQRFIIRPAFHAAESSLRLDFIVEKRETPNNGIVVCCVRTKKAAKVYSLALPLKNCILSFSISSNNFLRNFGNLQKFFVQHALE